jgi:hypothetical protein
MTHLKGDPLPKELSLADAVKLAEKWSLSVFPVEVYAKQEDWDKVDGKPTQIWWVAVPTHGSVYLPMDDYEKEWGDYVSYIDVCLLTSQLAETLPEAVLKASALEEIREYEFQKMMAKRKHKQEAPEDA